MGVLRNTVLFVSFIFPDRVSLCSLGCPRTSCVKQADLELRDPPVSASQLLGLKAWATTPGHYFWVKVLLYGTLR